MLRMDSTYLAGSLLGIWSALIGIDALHTGAEHAVSSLILLCLFIASFATILHCFPEKSCVEDPASEVGQGSYVPQQLVVAVQTS
jgi:hypothetical protein